MNTDEMPMVWERNLARRDAHSHDETVNWNCLSPLVRVTHIQAKVVSH
jgi:hypothetical protein